MAVIRCVPPAARGPHPIATDLHPATRVDLGGVVVQRERSRHVAELQVQVERLGAEVVRVEPAREEQRVVPG